MKQVFKFLIVLLLFGESFCTWYKVLMIDGFSEPGLTLEVMRTSIALKYPLTKPELLTSPLGIATPSTLASLWDIVEIYKKILLPKMVANPQGVILIGHSQGGLVARALAEVIPNHNIVKIITLGAPHMGMSALPGADQVIGGLNDVFESVKLNATHLGVPFCKIWYPIQGQVAAGGYWREPGCLEDYFKLCKFLPVVNNEVQHNRSEEFKNNFLKISQLIVINSNNDGIVIPWQTGQFGTRVTNDPDSVITPMTQQEVVYLNDSFGLQTLDKRGGLVLHRADGCNHLGYLVNGTVLRLYVYPHLVSVK